MRMVLRPQIFQQISTIETSVILSAWMLTQIIHKPCFPVMTILKSAAFLSNPACCNFRRTHPLRGQPPVTIEQEILASPMAAFRRSAIPASPTGFKKPALPPTASRFHETAHFKSEDRRADAGGCVGGFICADCSGGNYSANAYLSQHKKTHALHRKSQTSRNIIPSLGGRK